MCNNKIKVWTRINHAHYEEWKLVWADNPDGIPEQTMKTFNRAFWKMHECGFLRPLDELAAYQTGILAMIETWNRVQRGEVKLTACSPATYVASSGAMRLRQLYPKVVTPTREQYRELNNLCQEHQCDLQAITESLSDLGRAAAMERRILILHCVYDTLALCSEETQLALRAYLANNLNYRKTADQLKLSHSAFFWRRDNLYFPDFRRHCIWGW